MFRNVLVAIDGSAASTRALKAAVELAADQKANLTILHVIDDFAAMPMYDGSFVPANYMDSMIEGLKESGERIVDKAGKVAAGREVAPRSVMIETGGQSVAQAILEQARKLRADVIVLGTHGRRGLSRLLLGSDAEMVLREAPCPVLLVRAPDAEAQASKAATKAPARAAAGGKSAAQGTPATKGRTSRSGAAAKRASGD
jgi:nucleotide-binding universal stress UspA family protein